MLFNDRLTVTEAARLTNTTYPVRDYVTKTSFPAQRSDILGTEIILKYRDFVHPNEDPESEIIFHVKEVLVYVLRYDAEFPHMLIGVVQRGSNKGAIIAFRRTYDHPDDLERYIAVYPDQKYNFYMQYTKDVYEPYHNLEEDALAGTVLRCDAAEPAYSVIAEIDTEDKLRFVLSDEAICMIEDHPPKTEIYHESDIYELLVNLLGSHELYGK